jgi:fatty acid kinase fatty acid binding subunit
MARVEGVLIVTDGAVDLPPILELSGRVRVVPGEVWVGDEPFTGDRAEFWRTLRQGTFPSTTPPTVNAIAEAYRHHDLVVALHVSAELSATITRAREAAQRAGSGIVVVDTRSLSVGAGLLAAAADRAALDPLAEQSIVDLVTVLPDQLHTFVVVQDPEPLRRSGRAGLLPKHHVARGRPLVLAVRGRAILLDQPKDRAKALRQIVRHARLSTDSNVAAWSLGHGDASDLDDVTDLLSESFGHPPDFVVPIDPTVGAHVGPDAVVVGVLAGKARR